LSYRKAFGLGAGTDLFGFGQSLGQNFLGHLLGALAYLFHIVVLGLRVPGQGGRTVKPYSVAAVQAINDPAGELRVIRQGLRLRCLQ